MSAAALTAWASENGALLAALGVIGLLTAFASLTLLPVVLVRLPADYFVAPRRPPPAGRHPLLHRAIVIGRNVLGVLLMLAGVAMLVLPGQGILTLLVGLLLTDFPGKHALERRLVRRRGVLASINWLRRRAGRPPLRPPRSEENA